MGLALSAKVVGEVSEDYDVQFCFPPERQRESLVFANEWLCQCGKRANPVSQDWRWNGHTWEHHHGYPIGHVATERKPLEQDCTKNR